MYKENPFASNAAITTPAPPAPGAPGKAEGGKAMGVVGSSVCSPQPSCSLRWDTFAKRCCAPPGVLTPLDTQSLCCRPERRGSAKVSRCPGAFETPPEPGATDPDQRHREKEKVLEFYRAPACTRTPQATNAGGKAGRQGPAVSPTGAAVAKPVLAEAVGPSQRSHVCPEL